MQLPPLVQINNGQPPPGTFSDAELAGRCAKLRAVMAELDLDACVLTSMHNVNYFADFVYCSFGRPYALVVTPERFVTISANIDGGQPWRQTWGHDNIVYTDWQQDNFHVAVNSVVPARARIGIEFDHVTLERRDKFATTLPQAELVDVAPSIMRLRMVKSPEEHALIREGARICDIGGEAVVEALGEDVPEYEIALHSTRSMVRAIAAAYPHTELMDSWTWLQSGINTDGAHNPLTTRRVQPGDILSLNCFAMISGYYQALERTLFLGHCSDEHLRLWQINCEVHEKGLSLIRPGVRCMDIAHELNEIFAHHGVLQYRTFGYGHSFGSLSHYYGREAGLELREDIETVLQPGMVISMEPMIMLPQGQPGAGGYREHDILILTEQGADNITGFPYGPEHNIIR